MAFEIEKRSNLSYDQFEREYSFANKPVVITDALKDWKALRWTPEFFKREFGDFRFTINPDRNQKADYNSNLGTVEYTMSAFIDRVLSSTEEDPAPYFRNRILGEVFPSLRNDIEPLPPYFSPNWLSESYALKKLQQVFNRGAQIELYIGGRGGAFPVLHYDGLASHAFLMQIYGEKKFILYGPDQEQYMYGEPDNANLSQVRDVEHPDLAKFPLFAKAQPTTFILRPGELVFIPSKWWHTTTMLSPSISISVNVVNRSNWPALTEFVSSRRTSVMRMPSRLYLNAAGSWRSARDRRGESGAQVSS
jgi:hypothetical protein